MKPPSLTINDLLFIRHFDSEAVKPPLIEWVNKKVYRASDSDLTYRQLNELDKDNLLPFERADARGWRRFSFKELVYLTAVFELKKYGLKHDKLTQLKDSFVSADSALSPAEFAIGCVIAGVQIMLSVDSDGSISYADPDSYVMLARLKTSFIYVDFNKLINEQHQKMNGTTFPITWSMQDEYVRNRELSITEKEGKLLQIIRNQDYSRIEAKKKNGEIETVYAENNLNVSGSKLSEKDFLRTIKERSYGNVMITKRDGLVVNFKVQDAFKL